MKKKFSKSKVVAAVGASLLMGSLFASPAMSAPSETGPAPIQLSNFVPVSGQPSFGEITKNLSDAEIQLMDSGAPVIIHQEVGTAEITKVEKKSEIEPFALLPASNCS